MERFPQVLVRRMSGIQVGENSQEEAAREPHLSRIRLPGADRLRRRRGAR